MQFNSMQFISIQFNAIQINAFQFNAIQFRASAYAIFFSRLSQMTGKPWLRVKWGGSPTKDLVSCRLILQYTCKNLDKSKIPIQLFLSKTIFLENFLSHFHRLCRVVRPHWLYFPPQTYPVYLVEFRRPQQLLYWLHDMVLLKHASKGFIWSLNGTNILYDYDTD